MADFQAKIKAILDTSGINQQIANEISNKSIIFNKVTLNTNSLLQQVQSALNNKNFNVNLNLQNLNQQMNNISQQLNRTLNRSIGGITANLDNNRRGNDDFYKRATSSGINITTAEALGNSLKQIGFRSEDVNRVTQDLNQMDIQIKKISYSLNDNGGISVNIRGLQDLDTVVSLTRSYSDTGEYLAETNRIITKTIETQVEAEKRIQEQTEKNISAVTKYNSTLDSLKSKYGDSNSAKPITDQSHIQQLNAAYNEVESRIAALNNADEHTFGNLKAEVDASIQRVKDLAVQFQNAEYSANQLAAKPINVIKDNENQSLREFEANIKAAGINSQDFLSRVSDLHTQLANVGDKQSLSDYLNTLSTVKAEFKALKAEQKAEQKSAQENADLTNEKYRKLIDTANKISSLSVKKHGLDSEKDLSQITALLLQLDKLKKEYEQLKQELGGALSTQQLDGIKQIVTDTENKFKVLDAKLEDTKNRIRQTFEEKVSNGDLRLEIDEITSQVGNLRSKINAIGQGSTQTELHTKLEQIETDLNSVNELTKLFGNSGSMSTEEYIQNMNALEQTIARVKNMTRSATATTKQYATSMEIATLQNRMETWLVKNSKATKQFGENIKSLIDELKELASQGNVDKVEFDKLANSFRLIDQEAGKAGLKGKSFADSLKGALSSISRYISASTLIYSLISTVKNGIATVIDLDAALVDLKKTTDATESQLKSFYYSANDIAKQLGVTTKEVISAAAEWSRLGLTRIVPLYGDI